MAVTVVGASDDERTPVLERATAAPKAALPTEPFGVTSCPSGVQP